MTYMKKTLALCLCLFAFLSGRAQEFMTREALFHWGDDPQWKEASYDDSSWQTVLTNHNWAVQGMNRERTYAWYRIHFTPTDAWFAGMKNAKVMTLCLTYIDDVDETFLNGKKIGSTGRMPEDPDGFQSEWETLRKYAVNVSDLKVNEDNVIAVRIWNDDSDGGIFHGESKEFYEDITISFNTRMDGLTVSDQPVDYDSAPGKAIYSVVLGNTLSDRQDGTIELTAIDQETGREFAKTVSRVNIAAGKQQKVSVEVPMAYPKVIVKYTDRQTQKCLHKTLFPKYILTPKAPLTPRFNMAGLYGVRPGSPVIYRIPVSGERPMTFTIDNLPEGLALDSENGILSGSLKSAGDYTLSIKAENARGSAEAQLTIRVGNNAIALTPPMGWNAWNCWGRYVTKEKVISSARAMINCGLVDYGYSYVNIDDCWEAESRNPDGTIDSNEKFPDMKGLGEWLHSNGLKFGIYSSPGVATCAGFLGSLDHEEQDACTYNEWGVDYLKYDWCGYGRLHDNEPDKETTASYVRPYLRMERYLREQPRDIFYSLCQYGWREVWKWGEFVDGNSWRITGDINDSWMSLYYIGFCTLPNLYPYAKPGHWNDPDMLIVGKLGGSETPRDSKLTTDEQYTHISLWSLASANILIGCDLAQIDDFTFSLLCNNEVNAIDQDVLGKQARREIVDGDIQVWVKNLSDGTHAVGFFNLGINDTTVDMATYLSQLGLDGKRMRDVWRQQDIDSSEHFIPSHGVVLLKIY